MEENRLQDFQKLAELEPDDFLVRYGLGNEYFKAKRFSEAVQEFRKVVEIKPDYSAAYRMLGRSLGETGQWEEARRVFQEGIRVAEKNGDLQTKKEMEVFLRRLS
ncbi:MAG: tetratricopeptide repeat protein [Acidobacteria bacterium]|nr:tetratricopeptide repeat protein [Acidobacteriota bacterium]